MATMNWRKDYSDQLLFQCACGRVSIKINLNLSFNDKCCLSPLYTASYCQSIICCNALDRKLFSALISNAIQLECAHLLQFGKFWKEENKNSKCISSWTQPLAAALCLLQSCVRLISRCPVSCPEPIGSMSSMEVNVDMLEQMDLMDMSDHEALDVFLHSGGEENSAASPVAGRYQTYCISF